MSSSHSHGSKLTRILASLFFLLLTPFVLVFLISYLLYGLALQLAIWLVWSLRGQSVLLVYSSSPNWEQYVQTQLVQKLGKKSVFLNWSERKTWKRLSLAVLAFHYFGGDREFNPLAIVFRPLHWAKVFRFFKPFQDLKRGKTEPLERMQRDLFMTVFPR